MFRSRGMPWPERETVFAEPRLLTNAILDHVEQLGRRPHRRIPGRRLKTGDRNLLNFERHYIAATRQIGGRAGIVPRPLKTRIDDEARGTGGIRIHDVNAVPERASGHRDHSAELPAAKNADGCSGKDRGHSGKS